jgi:DNA-binding CsgD family transcriptional regulator
VDGAGRRQDQAGGLILGRDNELQTVERFVGDAGLGRCLVIAGDPGIGKTTLWEEAVQRGRSHGHSVVLARASQAEAALLFAAVADLLDGVSPDVLSQVPGPQRLALEVALRKAEPTHGAPEPFAIAAAFLHVLRLLAEQQALLVAVDDVQWLDDASAQVLLFAARRLAHQEDSPVRFVLSRRPGRQGALELAMQRAGLVQLELRALSFGAITHLLHERLGLVLPRRVQREVYAASQGNPLFALELGRVLAEREDRDIGADLPVPDLLDDIFGERVRGLQTPVRRALLAADLSANISLSELATFTDPLVLDDAITAGLLVVDRSRVRPSHPLLGAAARLHSTARERREVHLDLARAVGDPTLQARHRALATTGQDSDLATRLAAACTEASERGATHEAEELAAEALRLTPLSDHAYRERLLTLAQCHLAAGDLRRASAVLADRIADFPAGLDRARAHVLLGSALDGRSEDAHLELALNDAGDDAELRASALTRRVTLLTIYRVERLDQAEEFAKAALGASDRADLQQGAAAALAWTRILRGRPIDDLRNLGRLEPSGARLVEGSIDRPFGVRLAFRGELAQARAVFSQLRRRAEGLGDVRLAVGVTIQLCEVELRAGDLVAAARFLDELEGWSALPEIKIATARLHALHAAMQGEPAEVSRWADAVAHAEEEDCPAWDRLETVRARGIAALLEEDWSSAARLLMSVWDHTVSEGIDDPGAFPVAADLVEALVAGNDTAGASEVSERLVRLATDQDHPWGTVTSKRCAAAQLLAGDLDGAADALLDSAATYARLGFSFDCARTLLFAGRALRRGGKRTSARRALEEAKTLFAAGGSAGWSAAARKELAQVSGRRSGGENELTPSEQRVVDLVTRGLSNKEIAAQLFVSVYTVEAHLKHAYAKLGVRSRGQLTRLAGGVTEAASRP